MEEAEKPAKGAATVKGGNQEADNKSSTKNGSKIMIFNKKEKNNV